MGKQRLGLDFLGNGSLDLGSAQVDDQLAGANGGAQAAVHALAVVDLSQEVGDGDGFLGALLGAQGAADTADIAGGTGVGTLLGVVALDEDHLLGGNHVDQTLGAGLNAQSAALT